MPDQTSTEIDPVDQPSAIAPPAKTRFATKARPAAALRKVRMLTCQAGFNQIPARGADGGTITNPDGSTKMVNGGEFVRLPKHEYDIEAAEAGRLIESGQAVAV